MPFLYAEEKQNTMLLFLEYMEGVRFNLNIRINILYTPLSTLLWYWQGEFVLLSEHFRLVIIIFILMALMNGEIRCCPLVEFKGLKSVEEENIKLIGS